MFRWSKNVKQQRYDCFDRASFCDLYACKQRSAMGRSIKQTGALVLPASDIGNLPIRNQKTPWRLIFLCIIQQYRKN